MQHDAVAKLRLVSIHSADRRRGPVELIFNDGDRCVRV